MSIEHRAISTVREGLPFASPPRVLVVADDENAGEALALAEALDAFGAETEVRLSEDTTADEYGEPDAVIVTSGASDVRMHDYAAGRIHPILVGLTDAKGRGEQGYTDLGFDLVVNRPVSAAGLMKQLGDCLSRL